jgi:GntR family transcriptional regulator
MREELAKYQQIANDLRSRIAAGEYPTGTAIPSKPNLMKRYGAAQHTVDHAVDVLREDGLVEPQRGRGVFVLKPPESGPSEYDLVNGRIDEIAEEVRRLGQRLCDVERMLREPR